MKGVMTMGRIMFITALGMLLSSIPSQHQANPILAGYLTEVCPDVSFPYVIEFYAQADFGTLDGFSVETESGIFQVNPGIPIGSMEYKGLAPTDFLEIPVFLPEGDHVRLYDYGGGLIGEVRYGNDPADISAPDSGQSICGHFTINDNEELIIDFWYKDGSPSFGAVNDSSGALGSIRGIVTDHSTGLPVEGATAACLESEFETATDSTGMYSLRTLATRSTLEFSAAGYITKTTPVKSLAVEVDSTIVYDVELTPSSGIEPPEAGEAKPPRGFALSQNFPNPFNPGTVIDFTIPGFVDGQVPVILRVYDVRSRMVRTLLDASLTPGRHSVTWDGKDERGAEIGSGTYFYTVRAGEFTSTRKMIVKR